MHTAPSLPSLPCSLFPELLIPMNVSYRCIFHKTLVRDNNLFWYFSIKYFHFRIVPLRSRIRLHGETPGTQNWRTPRASISLTSGPWAPHLPCPSASPGITTGKAGAWPNVSGTGPAFLAAIKSMLPPTGESLGIRMSQWGSPSPANWKSTEGRCYSCTQRCNRLC